MVKGSSLKPAKEPLLAKQHFHPHPYGVTWVALNRFGFWGPVLPTASSHRTSETPPAFQKASTLIS